VMILTKLKMVEGGFCTKMGWIFFFTYLITFSIQQVMFTSFLIFKHLWL
jgi:hypothetical protein